MPLVVYFAFLSGQLITKDALSKVSRNFFKEFKMNYRANFDDVFGMLRTVLKFFQQSASDTIKSFMQFMLANLCETLAEEQFNLALIIFKEKNFVGQQ